MIFGCFERYLKIVYIVILVITRKALHFLNNCQDNIVENMINLLAMVANWRSRRKQTKLVRGKCTLRRQSII